MRGPVRTARITLRAGGQRRSAHTQTAKKVHSLMTRHSVLEAAPSRLHAICLYRKDEHRMTNQQPKRRATSRCQKRHTGTRDAPKHDAIGATSAPWKLPRQTGQAPRTPTTGCLQRELSKDQVQYYHDPQKALDEQQYNRAKSTQRNRQNRWMQKKAGGRGVESAASS